MKKTTQPNDSKKTKTLHVKKETLRKLDESELAQIQGGVFEYRSHQSSCC